MKSIALALILIAPAAIADTTISAVGALSNDLGYERTGFGIQLDNRQRLGDWGWSVQGMALSHAKLTGKGQRYQAIGMARRFHGQHFVEVGAQWRGYETTFDDGRVWTKYGTAAGIGVGTVQHGTEWGIRYFFPDNPHETAMFAVSMTTPLSESWSVGATVEQWRFDVRNERLTGTQAMIRVGYRF